MSSSNIVHYEQVAWMQELTDVKSNKKYYMLGIVKDTKDTFAVSPVDGNGETVFYCNRHGVAYGLHDVCLDCRMQVVGEASG